MTLLNLEKLSVGVLWGEDCSLDVRNIPFVFVTVFFIIVGVAYVIKNSMIHQIHHIQTLVKFILTAFLIYASARLLLQL